MSLIKQFPARKSLVSDIPAGDGKAANIFLQCNGYSGQDLAELWRYLAEYSGQDLAELWRDQAE
jgi:hypothetical protein